MSVSMQEIQSRSNSINDYLKLPSMEDLPSFSTTVKIAAPIFAGLLVLALPTLPVSNASLPPAKFMDDLGCLVLCLVSCSSNGPAMAVCMDRCKNG